MRVDQRDDVRAARRAVAEDTFWRDFDLTLDEADRLEWYRRKHHRAGAMRARRGGGV